MMFRPRFLFLVALLILLASGWWFVAGEDDKAARWQGDQVTAPESVTRSPPHPLTLSSSPVVQWPHVSATTAYPSPSATRLSPFPTLDRLDARPPQPTVQPPTSSPQPTVDRSCPQPPPRPEYPHYSLGRDAWPTPEAGNAPHFWLSAPVISDNRFRVSEGFPYGFDGGGRYLLHNGIDVLEPLGAPVVAVADGTVVVAQPDAEVLFGWRCDWYGHLVVVELDEQWRRRPVYALYGHVVNLLVRAGERVERGQPLAEVGVGGVAVAPHLHFEVRLGSNTFDATRNPALWLEPNAEHGVIAGRLLDPQGHPWQGVVVTAVGRSDGAVTRPTWTYLGDEQGLIKPDDVLAENFVIGELPAGRYQLFTRVQGVDYTATIDVTAGAVSTVEIQTEAYKTPTPTRPASPTPSATP